MAGLAQRLVLALLVRADALMGEACGSRGSQVTVAPRNLVMDTQIFVLIESPHSKVLNATARDASRIRAQ
jgi:hypothetical protein